MSPRMLRLCDALCSGPASGSPGAWPLAGCLDAGLSAPDRLTWYPQIDQTQGVWRVVAVPTEPLLSLTRRVVAPIGGVDVTPVIWVGLISLFRELLVGQQGVLSQILMRSQAIA